MKLLHFLRNCKKEIKGRMSRDMFNIDYSLLVLFGSYIRNFQKGYINYDELLSSFEVFDYNIISTKNNCFVVRDRNNYEYDLYYNEDLIELMAIYGDEEAKKCLKAILDWRRAFGYENRGNWENINNEWVLKRCNYGKHKSCRL